MQNAARGPMCKLLILAGEALGDIHRSSGARTKLLADVAFIIGLPLPFYRTVFFFGPRFRTRFSVMNLMEPRLSL